MSLYAKFWFASQFWLKPADRRPYTFILRDFYHDHPILWTMLMIGTGKFVIWLSWEWFIVFCVGLIFGHLFWGKKWVEGEQEYPEYLPSKRNAGPRP